MNNLKVLLKVGAFSLILFSSLAYGLISIDRGTYSTPALIINSSAGVDAVFNFTSRSPCHIHLAGENAAKLAKSISKPEVLKITIKVTDKFVCGTGRADLLSISPIGKENLSVQVGNNLKPL